MNHHHRFYQELPTITTPLAELLGNEAAFTDVPDDWSVVMLDVAGSTEAVAAGLHHEVNLAATGGIVAVLNVLRQRDAELLTPYFFGGDGATFLIPEDVLDEVLEVLDRYQTHVRQTLKLTLKVGAHSVRGVRAEQHTMRIAKLAVNDHLVLPIVLGTGVKYAEQVIKAAMHDVEEAAAESIRSLDLAGMECRWDEVKPPLDQQRITCLIVLCTDDALQGAVYAGVARTVDATFGSHTLRHPISGPKLKLDFAIAKTRQELSVRKGAYTLMQFFKEWFVTLIGPLYFRFSDAGKAYLTQVVELSHTLMVDGTFNAVLSGTPNQIADLTRYLDAEEAAGKLTYGHHVTHASLMSCYVVDRNLDHAHFIDGTEGGFTAASMVLKRKLAE